MANFNLALLQLCAYKVSSIASMVIVGDSQAIVPRNASEGKFDGQLINQHDGTEFRVAAAVWFMTASAGFIL